VAVNNPDRRNESERNAIAVNNVPYFSLDLVIPKPPTQYFSCTAHIKE